MTVEAELANAFRRGNMRDGMSVAEFAEAFVEYFPPKVEEVERSDTECVLKITNCIDAALVSCIISGDQNWPVHLSQEGGCEHTLLRIGNCALTVSDFFPKHKLVQIERIKFHYEIPLGSAVYISLQVTQPGRARNVSLLTGWMFDGDNEVELFLPAKVTTFKPRKKG